MNFEGAWCRCSLRISEKDMTAPQGQLFDSKHIFLLSQKSLSAGGSASILELGGRRSREQSNPPVVARPARKAWTRQLTS
ncbi:hypothetical protein ACCS96_47660, partial [Rhizobium ruizarguesonis]